MPSTCKILQMAHLSLNLKIDCVQIETGTLVILEHHFKNHCVEPAFEQVYLAVNYIKGVVL